MIPLVLAVQQDSSFWEVVPHDPASMFIYVLVLAAGVAIWRANRRKG